MWAHVYVPAHMHTYTHIHVHCFAWKIPAFACQVWGQQNQILPRSFGCEAQSGLPQKGVQHLCFDSRPLA